MKRVVVRVTLSHSTWAVLYQVVRFNFTSFVLTLNMKIVVVRVSFSQSTWAALYHVLQL